MRIILNWFVKITGWLPSLFLCRKTYYQNKAKQGRHIKGAAIIISNHKSLLDFPLLMFTFFSRNLRALTSEAVFNKNKPCKWFVTALGNIRVDRPEYDFSFVAKSLDALAKGHVVLIFPESKLPQPNQVGLSEFKTSAAYIALQSGVPVIPVFGDGKYFNKRVSLIIGEGFVATDLIDNKKSDDENILFVNQYMVEKMKQLEVELCEKAKNKKK